MIKTHDPNLIHWQLAQWQDHPSEVVQACLQLFRTISKNRQYDRGRKIGDHEQGGNYEHSNR